MMNKNLIVLHPNQSKIFLNNKTNRIVVAGRKFGKSSLALAELLRSAKENMHNVFIAPTYKMAKNTLWNDHIIKFLPKELIKEKNETELKIKLHNDNTITLFGADDPDRLRGANWDFVVMDEFQDFKPSSWEYVIEPNLLATKGRSIFMGTPKGKKNILYEQYSIQDDDYESYHYTSYDSPIIDKLKLEAIRKRLINSGKEDVWKQEYMAEFTTLAGLIYTLWDRIIHIQNIPIADGAFGLSIDRGIENPSAVGFYYLYQKEGDDRIHMFDEIYQSGLSASELCNLIKLKMGNRQFTYKFCDPSAKDFLETAKEHNLYIQPASREGSGDSWVLDGISKCKDLLMKSPIDGKPKFSVSSNCTNFIEEIESYIWDEQPDEEINPKDKPRKLNDHSVDQWRYFAVSYSKPEPEYKVAKDDLSNKNWSLE